MLAIGIYYDEAGGQTYTTSVLAPSLDPQKCADALAIHNDNGYPNEILLVKNDIIVEDFTLGHEYNEAKDVEDFAQQVEKDMARENEKE